MIQNDLQRSHCPAPSSVESAEDVFLMMAGKVQGLAEKRLWRLDLDKDGRVIGCEELAARDVDTVIIHPKDVFEGAVRAGAAEIVLVHNHPAGSLELHDGDHILTDTMAVWGEMLGVPLLDHVVVTEREWLSFRGRGLL